MAAQLVKLAQALSDPVVVLELRYFVVGHLFFCTRVEVEEDGVAYSPSSKNGRV
jgi:hypothetical protein